MANFGWAYINCDTGGAAYGPTGSIQFMSGSNDTTGTLNLMYYTASGDGYTPNTLVLTGTLIISGAVSASHYFIEDVTVIDSTGSTYFGNTNDDMHVRTGSMLVGLSASAPLFSVDASNQRIHFAAPVTASSELHVNGAATFSSTIFTTGSIVSYGGMRVSGSSYSYVLRDNSNNDMFKADISSNHGRVRVRDSGNTVNVQLDGSGGVVSGSGTATFGAVSADGAATVGSVVSTAGVTATTVSGSGAVTGATLNCDGIMIVGSTVSGSAFWDTTAGAFLSTATGNVTGVDSAVDRSLMVANGTSGKAITGSIVTMDPAGNITAPGQTFTVDKLAAGGSGVTSTGDISGSNDIISQRDVICNRDITAVRDITATRDIKSLNDFSGSQDLFIGRDLNIGRDAVIANSMTAGSVVSNAGITGTTVSGSGAVTGATLNCDGVATVGGTVSGSAFWDTTLNASVGNVTGVDSAIDRSLIVANGTSGKAITGSNVTMDPAGNISAPGQTFSVNLLSAGGGGVISTGPISGSSTLHVEDAATFDSTITTTGSIVSLGGMRVSGSSYSYALRDNSNNDMFKADISSNHGRVRVRDSGNAVRVQLDGSGGVVSGSGTATFGAVTTDGIVTVGSTVSGSAFWDTTAGAFMGPGNVTGVDSATDRSLMVANGTTGKAITGSIVTMDPAGNINAPGQTFTVNKLAAGGGGVTSTGDISGSNDFISQRDVISNRDITVVRDLTVTRDIKSLNDFSGSQDLFIGRDINIGRDVAVVGSMTAGSVVSTAGVTAATVSGSGAVTGATLNCDGVATVGSVSTAGITATTLHLSGAAGTEALRIGKGLSDTKEIVFENAGTDVGSIYMNAAETLIIANQSNNDDIQFQTKPGGVATTAFTIDGATANVGVGTISPLTALDVRWNPTGSLSDDTGGGDVVLFGAGSLTAGKLYYLHTNGTWTETDADAVATGADQLLGIALGSDPTDDGVLIRGFFDSATHLSNFSAGKAIYVSTTAAQMDTTAPSATADFVRIVGYCTNTANVIYFNPSSQWIELA